MKGNIKRASLMSILLLIVVGVLAWGFATTEAVFADFEEKEVEYQLNRATLEGSIITMADSLNKTRTHYDAYIDTEQNGRQFDHMKYNELKDLHVYLESIIDGLVVYETNLYKAETGGIGSIRGVEWTQRDNNIFNILDANFVMAVLGVENDFNIIENNIEQFKTTPDEEIQWLLTNIRTTINVKMESRKDN